MPRRRGVRRSMPVTEFDVLYRMNGRSKIMTIRERVPRHYVDKKSLINAVQKNWSTIGYTIIDIQNITLGTAECYMTEQEYLDACTVEKFETVQ